jgi:hypothetical protein
MALRALTDLDDNEPVAVIECQLCLHSTPAGEYCGLCQPLPQQYRCKGCKRRGAIIVSDPEVTTTIGAVGQNDDPGACTVNPGGTEPPGLNP